MHQLNNLLKKGIIVLIVAMLLTIPNIDIYLSLGSYQTDSSAIKANNYYLDAATKKTYYTAAIFSGIATIYVIFVLSVFLTKVAMAANAAHGLTPNSIEENNYDKYNFSQFDN